jgi:hypothetical protein
VTELNQQLEDLIKAKSEHEDALLQKFASLINSKKLKIRDQQRLLSTAKVDETIGKSVREARSSTARRAGPSRKGKRKANGTSEPSSESEDGFEAMPVDDPDDKEEREEMVREEETPQPTDDETESEEEQPKEQTVDRRSGASIGDSGKSKSKAPERPPEKAGHALRSASKDSGDEQEPEAPPPRRELPFAKRTGKAESKSSASEAKPAAPAQADDDETDDEL